MDDTEVIAALAALAQSTRLETFRLLVAREPDGVPAGELARLMEVPQNTMSAHLAVLSRAKLIAANGIAVRSSIARTSTASGKSRCISSKIAAAAALTSARP